MSSVAEALNRSSEADTPRASSRSSRYGGLRRWLGVPAVLLLLAAAALLTVDMPLAAAVRSGGIPGELRELFNNAEPFGHGVGVLLLAGAIFCLDPDRRPVLPRILWGALGAGLVANLVKLCVIRLRPRELSTLAGSALDTFHGAFPLLSGGGHGHGFPSAHTTVATALAVMLAHYYPKGRTFFLAMAVLVAVQRVGAAAHFPSDVCVGAAIGWLFAHAVLHTPRRYSIFPALEDRLAARRQRTIESP